MKDSELKKEVQSYGKDEVAVREFLLELLGDGEITAEQVLRILDESEEWPGGWPYDGTDGEFGVDPTFAVGVVTEFARLQGNEQAFCC